MDSYLDQNTDPTTERQNLRSLFSSRCEPSQTGNFSFFPVLCQCLGRIQRKTSYKGPVPELTITSPYVHWLQHIYHGQPYARVDLNRMPESTLSPSQGVWIWPLDIFGHSNSFPQNLRHYWIESESRFPLCKKRPEWRIRPDPDPKVWLTTVPTPPTLGHINKRNTIVPLVSLCSTCQREKV
jgi:hypothetical protein